MNSIKSTKAIIRNNKYLKDLTVLEATIDEYGFRLVIRSNPDFAKKYGLFERLLEYYDCPVFIIEYNFNDIFCSVPFDIEIIHNINSNILYID